MRPLTYEELESIKGSSKWQHQRPEPRRPQPDDCITKACNATDHSEIRTLATVYKCTGGNQNDCCQLNADLVDCAKKRSYSTGCLNPGEWQMVKQTQYGPCT